MNAPTLHRCAFKPWFLADWNDVTFLHFAIAPQFLQPHVPLPLDLYDGLAWVSLVAFTQTRLRPGRGGALAAWMLKPVAAHPFLNLRTYVRYAGHIGIQFLAEWIPNLLSRLIGRALYGLPLRLAHLDYRDTQAAVIARGRCASFRTTPLSGPVQLARENSLDHFLLERYTAFTARSDRIRQFHIRHDPWLWTKACAQVDCLDLVHRAAPWFAYATYITAHHSPGAFHVRIGRPETCARLPSTGCRTSIPG